VYFSLESKNTASHNICA